MRQYNDDDRNSKMSDLAQENDTMSRALYEIIEIFAVSEGIKPFNPTEVYLCKLLKQARELASKALRDLP